MNFNTMRLGSELSPEEQRYCLSVFVHRFTGNHRPAWANKPRPDGTEYPVQFLSDREWLANTKFYVTPDGTVDREMDHCMSSPTWPNNPELRRQHEETKR